MIDYHTIDSMREMAKEDKFRGATYETITRLCNEVELLKEELTLYRDRIMEQAHNRDMIQSHMGYIGIHEKEIHAEGRKPQRTRCYEVDFLVGPRDNPRLCKIEHVGVIASDAIHACGVAKKSLLEGKHIDEDPIYVHRVERI